MFAFIIFVAAMIVILALLVTFGLYLNKDKKVLEAKIEASDQETAEIYNEFLDKVQKSSTNFIQERKASLERLLEIGMNFNDRIYGPFLTDEQYEQFYAEQKKLSQA